MAANWHLGDVGSATDFSINASLGHPGAAYSSTARAGGRCWGRGVPGLPTSHGWEILDKRAGEGWCRFGYRSAFKHNTTIEIRLASRITVLKEGNGKKLAGPELRLCFSCVCRRSTLTKIQLLCSAFLLPQLENTFFWGRL